MANSRSSVDSTPSESSKTSDKRRAASLSSGTATVEPAKDSERERERERKKRGDKRDINVLTRIKRFTSVTHENIVLIVNDIA